MTTAMHPTDRDRPATSAFPPIDLSVLVANRPGPCVSVYAGATPGGGKANITRLRSQVKLAGRMLAPWADAGTARQVLGPLEDWLHDADRGASAAHGWACFAAREFFRVHETSAFVLDKAAVGTVFEIRPLLAHAGGGERFFVLTLSHKGAKLFAGTSRSLSPVRVPGMPKGIDDALRAHDSDEPLELHSFRRGTGPATAEAIFHGHGVGIDDHKDDLVRYFRAIDRALRPTLRGESAPLVLAAVGYLGPLYAEANSYPHLSHHQVPGNADRLKVGALHAAAWPVVASAFASRIDAAVCQYDEFRGTGRTAEEPADLVRAAANGDIGTLFIDPSVDVWGRSESGTSAADSRSGPRAEELTNLAAVHVLRHAGTVYPVTAARLHGQAFAGIRRRPAGP